MLRSSIFRIISFFSMFNETNRDEVYADLIGWLNEKAVERKRC